MYRNNKPVKDQKLPEHKGDIVDNNNESVIAPTVNGEKQEQEVKPQGGIIETGEKKEENNKQDQQQSVENKKLDQVAHDQTELNKNNINKNNNKTEERVSCEV